MSKVAKTITLPKRNDFNYEISTLEQIKALAKEAIHPHLLADHQAQVVVIIEVIEV